MRRGKEKLHGPSELEWTVHLAARHPKKAVFAALIGIGALLLSLAAFGSPLFTLLIAISLFASLADFYLPVHYRLTARGAQARHLWPFAFIEWKQVRRRTMSNEGIKLSPLRRPSRLEPFRGVLLHFGDQDPEQVLAMVRKLHGGGDREGDA